MVKTTAIFVGEVLLVIVNAAAIIYCVVSMINCCKKCMAKGSSNKPKKSSGDDYYKVKKRIEKESSRTKKTEITDKFNTNKEGKDFSKIIDFYKDDKEEKIRKTKEFFETLLGKEVEVRYYIHDPRGANLDVYTTMDEDTINKVISELLVIRIYECEFESIKYIDIQSPFTKGIVAFTLHVVDKEHIDEIIEKDYQYELVRNELDEFIIY